MTSPPVFILSMGFLLFHQRRWYIGSTNLISGNIQIRKVYYIRHAEPNYDNHDDASRELFLREMEDRKPVTEFLTGKHTDAAISIPYRRAVDTIKDFTAAAGLKIEIEEDFRERKIGGWIVELDFDDESLKLYSIHYYKLYRW